MYFKCPICDEHQVKFEDDGTLTSANFVKYNIDTVLDIFDLNERSLDYLKANDSNNNVQVV